MNLAKFLLSSRGIRNMFTRTIAVLNRLGMGPGRIEKILLDYIGLVKKFETYPTFPITAIIVDRYPDLVRKLVQAGAHFAIHGLVHTDYTTLSYDKQKEHIKKAIEIFKKEKIPFSGFRAPYLRWNPDLIRVVAEARFLWEGSKGIEWNVIKEKNEAYNKVITLSGTTKGSTLPHIEENLVYIPVSMPDDESLIDRLKINPEDVKKIWLEILKDSYKKGEQFTLQLHHERFPLLKNALYSVLSEAKKRDPPVWITTQEEIARWWKERHGDSPRWPNGARSAISITGDIDVITVKDFIMRIFEI